VYDQKMMTKISAIAAHPVSKQQRGRSEVKGPIRCHKCQLLCRDAEHYLSHKCEPRPSI